MCGIVGVFSPSAPVERSRLDRALQSLKNRGPDGFGTWWSEDQTVGLGHTLLAVNNPEGGAQPIVSETGVAVVNGEFYGLPKATMGESDSYVLPTFIRRYEVLGALERLRGEFAFLWYDRVDRKLIAARDRFGIKPLYWARRENEYWFASKPSALWEAGVVAGWSESGFLHAAATQYAIPGDSFFQGVKAVRPGRYLVIGDKEESERRYWRVPETKAYSLAPVDLLERLSESVNERLRPNEPNAVLLSGGVDSATVSALAARTETDVKAYTVDFPNSGEFAEANLARLQADRSKIPLEVIPLTGKDILEALKPAVQGSEGLCVNGHLPAKMALAQTIAADGRRVLLTGEGSDELFFGYRHFADYFGEAIDPTADTAGLGILTTLHRSVLPDHMPRFFASKRALGERICRLLGLGGEVLPLDKFEVTLSLIDSREGLDRAREVWLETALSGYILEVLGDGTEMAHSLEGRPPFLDHRLWELGYRPERADKALLREAVKGLVVEEIRTRPKHPFMAPPLGLGLWEKLREQVADCNHPFVKRREALETLERVKSLTGLERLEWEPAMLWVLSSFYLQELWK